MVNAGRVACIFTPFVVTLVSLACLIFVFLGGAKDRNSTLDDLYFAKVSWSMLSTAGHTDVFEVDLTNLTSSSSANLAHAATGTNLTNLAAALQVAKQEKGLSDYYTIYLQGYCQWNGNDVYANCSSPKFMFDFNITDIWGLDLNTTGVSIDALLGKGLKDSLDAYNKVSKAMSVMYVAAAAGLALTVLVGISAIFSRWGSFCTMFFASAAALFFLAGTAIALALFAALKTALDKDLKKDYGVETTLGKRVIVVSAIGTALAIAGAVFWLFSVCCCSGR